MKKIYFIFVNNLKAQSHNINIDIPMFECLALNQYEALGKMILSDWPYKSLPIYDVIEWDLI